MRADCLMASKDTPRSILAPLWTIDRQVAARLVARAVNMHINVTVNIAGRIDKHDKGGFQPFALVQIHHSDRHFDRWTDRNSIVVFVLVDKPGECLQSVAGRKLATARA